MGQIHTANVTAKIQLNDDFVTEVSTALIKWLPKYKYIQIYITAHGWKCRWLEVLF
jgi:hypothetical protein